MTKHTSTHNVINRDGKIIYRGILPADRNGLYRFASGYGFLTADIMKLRGYSLAPAAS